MVGLSASRSVLLAFAALLIAVAHPAARCPSDCSGRGACDAGGACLCAPGWLPPDCAKPLACPNNCTSRGECILGECSCAQGFAGNDCSIVLCANDCSGHGVCTNLRCSCDAG